MIQSWPINCKGKSAGVSALWKGFNFLIKADMTFFLTTSPSLKQELNAWSKRGHILVKRQYWQEDEKSTG